MTEETAAISVQGLQKVFKVGFSGLKAVEALERVDLTVQPGEIYGFLGPNGAGKSTTIKVLTCLIRPTAGSALVFGEPLSSPKARQRIGYLPENPVFYDYLTGLEFMRYYGALLGLSRSESAARAQSLLDRVGLAGAAKLQLRRYSKGMTQRIGLAQALMGDPDLVILDEPVSGLDPIGRREMRELMLDLKARKKTVFFSTHIIPDVEMIGDRVGIIIAGRMVKEGTVAELLGASRLGTEIVLSGLAEEAAAQVFEGMTMRDLDTRLSVLVPAGSPIEPVLGRALEAGAKILTVQPERRALEDIFIDEISARASEKSAPRAAIKKGAA
ncbi:MAG: ABC transporter ATP-binding protein [Myxococcota bacterium]